MPRGRPATGSIVRDDNGRAIGARITLADGSRKIVPFKNGPVSDERAKELAAKLAKRARELGVVPVDCAETVSEWFERWMRTRDAKGLRSTRQDRGRFRKWIAPTLGHIPVTDVTRRDLEALVQHLDHSVATSGGDFKWKSAILVWGICSKMFADACKSKVLDLRIREDNPARDVQGPDRGVERSGPYLFPAEFDALMRCARVPDRWKRLIAIAIGFYVRRGELEALEWSDIHLEQRYVHVHRACDERGNVKPTKTRDTRRVPIEPSLVPLLERMREMAHGEGRVITSMPRREELAERLRKYVEWACADAGIALRAELVADDETRRPLSWHDLRHTGITWRAVRGDEPLKVQRAAGHSDLRTTQRYINEAQTFEDTGTFGEPFPPLDLAALLPFGAPPSGPNIGLTFGFSAPPRSPEPGKTGARGRPQRDSNATGDDRESTRTTVKDGKASRSADVARGLSASANPQMDAVEAALAKALEGAAAAGEWATVAQLARELEARRVSRAVNVIPIARRSRIPSTS